jgi:hypothetical protein
VRRKHARNTRVGFLNCAKKASQHLKSADSLNCKTRIIARLSCLCGEVFPGQEDDVDFFGVGWLGRDALNLAAMRTRRSLPAMSAVDGWTLVVYQGARAR